MALCTCYFFPLRLWRRIFTCPTASVLTVSVGATCVLLIRALVCLPTQTDSFVEPEPLVCCYFGVVSCLPAGATCTYFVCCYFGVVSCLPSFVELLVCCYFVCCYCGVVSTQTDWVSHGGIVGSRKSFLASLLHPFRKRWRRNSASLVLGW